MRSFSQTLRASHSPQPHRPPRNILRRVYPVHRLDKPTSGVLLFALSPSAARVISAAFADGRVQKSYLAVVRGCPPEEGVIDHPLVEEPDGIEGGAEEARVPRPALTEYRRLATAELSHAVGRYPTSRYSLVEICPRTGRRHQIRRHFKHIFHPLVGDTKYGEGRHNRFFRENYGCHRLLLAAVGLTFPHPCGGDITVKARPEESFLSVTARLGWNDALFLSRDLM
jgi:tRNA pseudouridine65 synthase